MVLKLMRRGLEATLFCLVLGSLGLAGAAQLGPLDGYELYAVRSASMTPALGVGDLVVAERVDAAEIHPGDVVTAAVGGGRLVTHRVVGLESDANGPSFSTKGDANATADPVAVPASQVRGRVGWHMPLLGFLLAMITMPSGIVSLLSTAAALLVAIWILEDLDAEDEADRVPAHRQRRWGGRAITP